jgi:hypothetical protein
MMGFNGTRVERPLKSQEDQIDYNLIYAISFATCLAANAGVRLAHWSSFEENTAHEPRKSVLQQARSDASTMAAFAFMR